MKVMNQISTMVAGLAFASLSHAAIITEPTVYEVTNFDHGEGKHALWTNGDYKTSSWSAQDLWFSVDHMGTDDISDDEARLYGTVQSNGNGMDAHIDLVFTDAYTELDQNEHYYKQELGLAYADLMQNNPVFWAAVLGSITIGENVYDVDRNVVSKDKSYTFQFGMGANAKNAYELGGSSWVQTCKRAASVDDAGSCMDSHHWDLNLGMRPVAVPEPGTVALLAAGIAGLLVSRKTAC